MLNSYISTTGQMSADVESFGSASRDGISILCLLPWIASTIYECAARVGISPTSSRLDDIDLIIRECRHRAKLLEGSPKLVDGFSDEFRAIVAGHHDYFLKQPVRFRILSKYLITDMGIIYLEGKPIATTHVFQFLLGGMNPSVDELLSGDESPAIAIGHRLGANLAQIGVKLGLAASTIEDWPSHIAHRTTQFHYIDTKSSTFYTKLTKGLKHEDRYLGHCFSLFATLLRIANSLPTFGIITESTQLRIKFLTLYAIINSAKRIIGRNHYQYSASKNLLEALRHIAYSEHFKKLGKSKSLRNSLVHYAISSDFADRVNPEEATFAQIADALQKTPRIIYETSNLNLMINESLEAFDEFWPKFFVKPQPF